MWTNPFGSEAGAFRFALLTAVAFAVVAVAALTGGTTVALVVWACVSVAAAVLFARGRQGAQALPATPAHVGPVGERRLIVLAQTTPPAEPIGDLARRADRIVVVSAAAPSPLHWLTSDNDDARGEAGRRVAETIERLRAAHFDAVGVVGDEDPVRAVEDALQEFGGDEILIATGRRPRELAVAARVREHVALPITHVVA